jgi:hypothetical protein
MKQYRKSEGIKVRVEPLSKLALTQIAQRESLDLSDVVRKAIREYINKYQTAVPTEQPNG